jgi:hypothetical protein
MELRRNYEADSFRQLMRPRVNRIPKLYGKSSVAAFLSDA